MLQREFCGDTCRASHRFQGRRMIFETELVPSALNELTFGRVL